MPYKKSKFFIYWFFGGKNNILKKKEYPKIINDINIFPIKDIIIINSFL